MNPPVQHRAPRPLFLGLFLSIMLSLPVSLLADGSERFGDYVIYFNAFSSDQLSPEMARAYGISRSGTRALVNISIQRVSQVGPPTPVDAVITSRVRNLTGQLKQLELRRIQEGQAIYYIGEIDVAHREVLVFDLNIRPEGENRTHDVRFQESFYVD